MIYHDSYLLRRLTEKYREACKDLQIVFIDLEKSYDKVPREVMWWVLEMKEVPLKYIELIKDIYDGSITSVRTSGGITSEFPITIDLHQESALSLHIFALVMNEITKSIQVEVPRFMLFTNDIVLVDETRSEVNAN